MRTIDQLKGRLKAGTLQNNSLWIMVATAMTSLLGYAYWIAVAHIYAAHIVGVATSLISLMTVTALASNLGAAPAIVQRLPTRKTVEDWSITLSAGVLGGASFGAVGALVVLACVPLFSHELAHWSRNPVVAAAFILGTMWWVASIVLDAAFIAERQGKAMSARNTIFAVSKIPLVVIPGLALTQHSGVVVIICSWVVATMASSVLSVLFIIPRIKPGARVRLTGVAAELRETMKLLLGNHFVTLGNVLPNYLLPVVVISRLDAADAAYFYATWMVGGIFFMISSAVGSALYAEGAHNPQNIGSAVRASARFTTMLLVPAMAFVLITAPWILSLFGSHYEHSGTTLLRVLTVAAIADAITNLYVPVLRVHRRLITAGMLTMGMAIFAVFGAWVIAPTAGLTGIGVMWFASQALGSVWVAFDVWWQGRGQRSAIPTVDPPSKARRNWSVQR